MTDEVPKRKRGRKAKVKTDNSVNVEKIPKKRGRKPKGGKIITNIIHQESAVVSTPNIILHLKCGMVDLEQNSFLSNNSIENFQFEKKINTFQNIDNKS